MKEKLEKIIMLRELWNKNLLNHSSLEELSSLEADLFMGEDADNIFEIIANERKQAKELITEYVKANGSLAVENEELKSKLAHLEVQCEDLCRELHFLKTGE